MRPISEETRALCEVLDDEKDLPAGFLASKDAAKAADIQPETLYYAMRRLELKPFLWRGRIYWNKNEVATWARPANRRARAMRGSEAVKRGTR